MLPGSTGTPAAFHLATDSGTFFTMKPTWLTTDPTVPPVAGGEPAATLRLTTTPGKVTRCRRSSLVSTPPMPTKIFLLAATSRELRCQWPMVTPASFGV